jgi:NAD(P)-dependent dehydrogenase (short-subunit alcohol dehydrogenase family)
VKFSGRNCLVTGAAGNLGRAVSQAFAAEGASLILMDHAEEHLRSAYGSEGEGMRFALADLRDSQSVARALPAGTRVDILCNIAGGFRMGQPVHETSDETWDLMLGLNARSVLNCVRAVVPGMLAAGWGKIINVGAMAALSGKANMAAYIASKSAVIRLTESMAAELRDKGINVNCILPSTIDTPQNRKDMPKADPKRWVAPEALADVVLFLASDAARAIHGASIPVVGLA